MKKFAVTILAILYLVTSTGATVHMHYCMGKLISAGLWHSKGKKDACSTCGMAKKKGCCEDRHKILKIDKQYKANSIVFFLPKLSAQILVHKNFDSEIAYSYKPIIDFPKSNSPPGTNKVPIYIINCVHRI